MNGLIRAEWLRFRKRRSLQIIVLAVPLLVAFFFVAGYASIGEPPPPFDEVATRQRLIDEGFVLGFPPEEVEAYLAQAIESERLGTEEWRKSVTISRSLYAFPQSLVVLLGNATFIYFALILLAATTIGDEFGWGTIRTTLLASSHRARILAVRLAAIGVLAVVLVALLLVLGVVMPLALAISGAALPPAPAIDTGALGVAILGMLVASALVIAFSAMATLLVRSGSLTLVVMLVYVLVEGAINALLLQFAAFRHAGDFGVQDDGTLAWLLDALPVRGIATLSEVASRAASNLPRYPGDLIRDLDLVTVPLVALFIWGALFIAIAFRRFTRMDIVE